MAAAEKVWCMQEVKEEAEGDQGMKTLREAMGLQDSIGNIKLGDMVRVKTTGHIGKVKAIGRYGLLDIQGCMRLYTSAEIEKIDKKITA